MPEHGNLDQLLEIGAQATRGRPVSIRPCGLSPAKSKAIRGLSEILVREHDGRVPDSFEELEALPGHPR